MVWKLKSLFSRRNDPSARPDGALDATALVQRGTQLALRQDWRAALECFRGATNLDPNNAVAHAFSGNVLRQLGEFDAAIAAYERALAIKADYEEVHYNRGTLLHQAHQLGAALASFESALAINPSLIQAHCRRADILRELRQPEAAEMSYRRAIALMPGNADAHFNLGLLQSNAGSHDDALKSFDAAIGVAPGHAGAHAGRGIALMALGRPREALTSYDLAIQLKPDFARVYSNRAGAEAQLGLLSEARASHEQAVKFDPQDAAVHFNRGAFLSDRKEWQEAANSYHIAVKLKPDYAEAHCNLGLSLQEMGLTDLAIRTYTHALEIEPKLATALNNRGNLFRSRKQFAEALQDYREALALEPDSIDTHYNIGQLALLQGNFAVGWSDYEWRELIEEAKVFSRRLPQPRWSGETSLQGRRIFLYAEQGLGDTIQFCRYTSLVAARGAHVTLEVQRALGELLADLDGVSELVLAGSSAPHADYQCSLMSLPGAFKTTLETIPCQVPYLHANPKQAERCLEMLGPRNRPRVGLAWSGNPRHSNDRNRSMELRQMISHLPSEFEYYCLQNEIRDADQETLRSSPKITIREFPLKSFLDTAALLEALDLVITVDTSVAHLSGAMGKRTWILLPYLPDWRWMLDRTDSPWYPTATLYRQAALNDWDSVMSVVRADLRTSAPIS
jgi:tetratricopeptide (TPR) repeat protein